MLANVNTNHGSISSYLFIISSLLSLTGSRFFCTILRSVPWHLLVPEDRGLSLYSVFFQFMYHLVKNMRYIWTTKWTKIIVLIYWNFFSWSPIHFYYEHNNRNSYFRFTFLFIVILSGLGENQDPNALKRTKRSGNKKPITGKTRNLTWTKPGSRTDRNKLTEGNRQVIRTKKTSR